MLVLNDLYMRRCVGFHTSHIPEKLEQGYYAKLLQSVNRNSLDPISKQVKDPYQ